MIPKYFGSATSTAFQLREMGLNVETIAADSTITAILVNFGIWGFIILLLIFIYPLYIAIKNGEKKMLSLSLLLLMSSMTMMVFEIFPVNLLLAVSFSTIIAKNSSTQHYS